MAGNDFATPVTGRRRTRTEAHALPRYLQTLRERLWLIVAITALTTAAAVAYVALAPKRYEAEALLLVTPISNTTNTYSGLGLLYDTSDPTTNVTTAAALVQHPQTAMRAKRALRLSDTSGQLLGRIDASPIAQSNLVSITATASEPAAAARLANAFARAVVAYRTAQLHARLDRILPGLRSQERSRTLAPRAFRNRVAALEVLRGKPDPTIAVESLAEPPASASSPRPRLTIVAAIFGGLVLGLLAAFALREIDPRLRSEEQLREVDDLPVLTRIPSDPTARGARGPLTPAAVAAPTAESFRTLRAVLTALRPEPDNGRRSILITSSSPGEGKTTVALNLAFALARSGGRVILIEADVRHPTIGEALSIGTPEHGIADVLVGQVTLDDALVRVEQEGLDLRALLVEQRGEWIVDRLSLPTARQLVADAEAAADYVVIDSPPLTQVSDALPLASEVDDVLLVAAMRRTNVRRFAQLAELLESNAIAPAGVALIGVAPDGYVERYIRRNRAAGERDRAAAPTAGG